MTKQGKYLWDVTVRQVNADFKTTYTLADDALMNADFDELAKRALGIAHKDKENWSDTATLYVIGIEYVGTIDG